MKERTKQTDERNLGKLSLCRKENAFKKNKLLREITEDTETIKQKQERTRYTTHT